MGPRAFVEALGFNPMPDNWGMVTPAILMNWGSVSIIQLAAQSPLNIDCGRTNRHMGDIVAI